MILNDDGNNVNYTLTILALTSLFWECHSRVTASVVNLHSVHWFPGFPLPLSSTAVTIIVIVIVLVIVTAVILLLLFLRRRSTLNRK